MKLFPLPEMRTPKPKAASGFSLMPAVHRPRATLWRLAATTAARHGTVTPAVNISRRDRPAEKSAATIAARAAAARQTHNSLGNTFDCHPCCAVPSPTNPRSTYGNTSIGGTTFYATGITDARSSCGCHQSSVAVTIWAPGGSGFNSSGGGEYVQTTASYGIHPGEFDTEDVIEVTIESDSFCPQINQTFIDTTSFISRWISRFTAVFKKSHFNAFIGKWVYVREVCTGQCQPPQWCSTQECEWLFVNGFRVSSGMGTIGCQPIAPYPQCAATRPQCKQVFGGVVWGGDFECN